MPILGSGGGKVRLAYCTNVHPGEDLESVKANLDRFAVAVRERVAPPGGRLGVGLWLAAPAAAVLAADAGVAAALRRFLDERGLTVFTLNAFPYGGFHSERVKRSVYRPAWHEEARLQYTIDAARALAALLPEAEEEGTVSTLPIGWRADYGGAGGAAALATAAGRVAAALAALAALREATGKRIRLLFEPEPGCRIETTDEVAEGYRLARAFAEGRGVAGVLEAHLGVCFDCCHQAVLGEDLAAGLRRLRDMGARVGKVHLSCAVKGPVRALGAFEEPRYLHQVVAAEGGERAGDLAEISADPRWRDRRVRVHFHVPIHAARLAGGLETTQSDLAAALDEVLSWPEVPDLEVETYTWPALPRKRGEPPLDLAPAIAEEMRWALGRIRAAGRPC